MHILSWNVLDLICLSDHSAYLPLSFRALLPNSKGIELGSSNQKASRLLDKNTGENV